MDIEYRCTRNVPYSHNCLGHKDISARQGYYITASSQSEAWEKMASRFPEEASVGFTVEEWKGSRELLSELTPKQPTRQ